MSKEDLLRFANEQKPADFAAEFKNQLHQRVASKLVGDDVADTSDSGGDEE